MITTNMCEKDIVKTPFCSIVKTMSADDLYIAVEYMFTWYWIADFCEDNNITFPLGLPFLWFAKRPSGGPCFKKQLKKY